MTRCTITCMEPGCKAHIRYETDPEEVGFTDRIPLYCELHRTEEGRHSASRENRIIKPVLMLLATIAIGNI